MTHIFETLSQLAARDSVSQVAAAAARAVAADKQRYGYIPDQKVASVFLVLYGLSTILHLGQATYFCTWWLFPTACACGFGELIGWGARLWSSSDPQSKTAYLMQITTTMISPTPLLAVNFIVLARIVQRLGTSYSWLTPKWYTIIFLTCDFVALTAQGVGGGMASSAKSLAAANVGANVMLGGIVFQFAAIVVYSSLAGDFFRRYFKHSPVRKVPGSREDMTPRLKIMIGGLVFSTTCLFIRSVYRTIELTDGWTGRIIHTELYFNVLDGAMVTLAIFTMNMAHPGFLLGENVKGTSEKELGLESRDSNV
ncbi:RTA1 like protein [Mycena rebaudengoi]|nr:RTA1 like protein [Mycena rebaudengoi]